MSVLGKLSYRKNGNEGRSLRNWIIATIAFILSLGLPTSAFANGTPSPDDVSSAVRYNPDGTPLGTALVFSGSDDASTRVNLDPSFPINFFGNKYESFCVDINGVVHFANPCGSSSYNNSMEGLAKIYNSPVISPIAADLAIPLDQNNNDAPWSWGSDGNSGIYFYSDQETVVVTWFRITPYVYRNGVWDRVSPPAEVLTFQFVAEKRDTGNLNDGFDFNWEWNYGTAQSERSGYTIPLGGSCINPVNPCYWSVGWTNYDPNTDEAIDVFNLLGEPRLKSTLVDGGSYALVSNRLNSEINGRYRLAMIGGEPVTVINDPVVESGNNNSAETSSPTLAATGFEGYPYLLSGLFLTLAGISVYSGSVVARRRQS
jgi:hypothetical protein